MLAHETGAAVFFVEKLDLSLTCPPRVKPYLLYRSAQGILSQHERMPEARRAYYDYLLHSNPALGIFPGAAIYK